VLCAEEIHGLARSCGFALSGLARAEPLDPAPLARWLEAGMAASMAWMRQRASARLDPSALLPGARTVLALGACLLTSEHAAASPIALYAQGRDYHATLRDRLKALRRRMAERWPDVGFYGEVDTGPVMEKAWAARAGLGWIGKNGMLVTREHGSHVLLAVAYLSGEVDAVAAPHPERCGTCERCHAACPTGAITSPGVVDARRCLAHQTIEDRGPYAPELRPRASGWAFGCDGCQRVCPWNRPGHACGDARFTPRPVASLSLLELASLSPEQHLLLTRGTAVARVGYDGLRRSALVALGAARDPSLVPAARGLADAPSGPLREAARWALAQVEARREGRP
jgi:epoxyqueuosine reductase